ncbi:MAG: helix-turn-helix transcriptional regulator [Labilithrix sp.]|nr:helix-turn-helix transcriptional regulator [Labilithrix sp.]MCW5813379.1 helix-turn-helix transcriptional regulator [Labilithrix sp.]
MQRGFGSTEDVAEASHLLQRALDVQAVSIGPGFGFSPLAHVHGIEDGWRELHMRHLSWDPSPAFLDHSGGEPYRVMTHSTARERAGPLVRGLARFGYADGAVSRYDTLGGSYSAALYRGEGGRPFEDGDALVIRLLAPWITNALGSGIAKLAISGDLARVIPLAWVDLPSLVLYKSPSVNEALVLHLDISTKLAQGRLFTTLVARASRVAKSAPPPLVVSARHQIEASFVDPTRSGPRPRRAADRRLLFALCERPANTVDEDALFSLTPTQREVATRVAEGLSLPRVARELGMSYETARYHLRDVYRQLGVHGRAELRARFPHR